MEIALKIFTQIRKLFLDIFFPVECLGCGKEDVWLCDQCLEKIELNKNYFELIDFWPSFLDGFFVAANWQNKILQKTVHSYKYNFAIELGQILEKILTIKIEKTTEIYPQAKEWLIMPVPLHKQRLAWRGFNQAEILVKLLADKNNLKMRKDLLKRIKNTKPQVGLKSLARANNISGAFRVIKEEEVKDKVFLLVDDIITTGATMNECAKTLKEAGADKVYGLAIARG